MMTFQLANDLGILSVGRAPQWLRQTKDKFDGIPTENTDGKTLIINKGFAVVSAIGAWCRADNAFHQSRIYIDVLDDTATYTATIAGIAYAYTATVGQDKTTVLTGIAGAINVGEDLGVSAINLTFADNTPSPDTITRATGSFVTDGVLPGHTISVSGSVSNDDTYTVAEVTATVLTLVEGDALTAEGPSSGINIFLQKTHASVVDDTIRVSNLADDVTQNHTTVISATGTAEVSFDEDITEAAVYLWGYVSAGTGAPERWAHPLAKDGFPGYVETISSATGIADRIVTAGVFTRLYLELRNVSNPSGNIADAVAYLYVGPCKLENSG